LSIINLNTRKRDFKDNIYTQEIKGLIFSFPSAAKISQPKKTSFRYPKGYGINTEAYTQPKEIEANAQRTLKISFAALENFSGRQDNPFCLLPSFIPFPFCYLFRLSFLWCLRRKTGEV
jgi:hypothetical protein